MRPVPITAAALSVKGVCLNEAGEVLLCRNDRDEWELPGGRPQSGEDYANCLRRELLEETGLSVDVCAAIDASSALEVLPGRWVHIVTYECRARDTSGLACSDEHHAVRFVGLNELAGLHLPDVYRTAIESWIDRMDADESRGPSQAETDAAGPCLAELCLAMELADIADGLALQFFRGSEVAVQTKPDGSPVTEADLAIENAMRARLAVARPDHGIVGEEAGSSGNARSRWYVDPIDGTSRFLIGDPQWYTFIALADGDTVTVSVISAPALGLRWWALRGAGAFCNGRPMAVSRTRTLAEAVVNDDWRGTLRQGILDRPLSKIARRCNRFRPYEGHSYLAIADGHGDIAAGAGGGPWDYAAVKLIVEEAGGRFTDLDGLDSFSNGSALVSNGLVHDEAIAELERAADRLQSGRISERRLCARANPLGPRRSSSSDSRQLLALVRSWSFAPAS
jgi:histidinol-phosphatase